MSDISNEQERKPGHSKLVYDKERRTIVAETELRSAGPWQVGSSAHRIVMRRDGAGPMGWYDVIHVYDYGGKEIRTLPAHHTTDWELCE